MRPLSLVEWILLGMIGVTLLALAVPTWAKSRRHDEVERCRGNLRSMHAAAVGAPKDPKALGFAYWTRLNLPAGTLRCPMVPEGITRPCDYLGPKTDAAGLDPKDPLGCDIPENHGEHGKMGGNVLYKNGEIRTLHPRLGGDPDDPWRDAAGHKCGP
jgi:hypothetical protein